MENRMRACVQLQSTDTGELVMLYSVDLMSNSSYSAVFAASFPLDQATTFRDDAETFVSAMSGQGGELPAGGTRYGLRAASELERELYGARPLAVAYMEDMIDCVPSCGVMRIECYCESWEYYCAAAREGEEDGRR